MTETMPGMIERFGRVLNWTGTGLAILVAIAATISAANHTGAWIVLYPLAVVLFLGGRASRYVLAGAARR